MQQDQQCDNGESAIREGSKQFGGRPNELRHGVDVALGLPIACYQRSCPEGAEHMAVPPKSEDGAGGSQLRNCKESRPPKGERPPRAATLAPRCELHDSPLFAVNTARSQIPFGPRFASMSPVERQGRTGSFMGSRPRPGRTSGMAHFKRRRPKDRQSPRASSRPGPRARTPSLCRPTLTLSELSPHYRLTDRSLGAENLSGSG